MLRKYDIILLHFLKRRFKKIVDWYWYINYYYWEVKRFNLRSKIYHYFTRRKLYIYHYFSSTFVLFTYILDSVVYFFCIYIVRILQYIHYILLGVFRVPLYIQFLILKLNLFLPLRDLYLKPFLNYLMSKLRIIVYTLLYFGQIISNNIITSSSILFNFSRKKMPKIKIFFVILFLLLVLLIIMLLPFIQWYYNTPLVNSFEHVVLPVKGSIDYYEAFLEGSCWTTDEIKEIARRANLIPDIYRNSIEYYEAFIEGSTWTSEELRELARRTPYLPEYTTPVVIHPQPIRRISLFDALLYWVSAMVVFPFSPSLAAELTTQMNNVIIEHFANVLSSDIESDPTTAPHKFFFYSFVLVGAAFILLSGFF